MKVLGERAVLWGYASTEQTESVKRILTRHLVAQGADESQVFTGSEWVEVEVDEDRTVWANLIWAETLVDEGEDE